MSLLEFHTGGKTGGKSFYFEMQVGPQPETVESYVKRLFSIIGLRDDATIKAYERFTGQAFFAHIVSNARSDREIAALLKNPQGTTHRIKVHVFPEVVEHLKRFGINLLISGDGKATFNGHAQRFAENVKKYQDFTPAPSAPVSQWSTADKLGAVIRRAALLLPESVGNQLLSLISPWSLGLMGIVVIGWAIGHFFAVSEIADVLLILGALAMGAMALQAGSLLVNFATKTYNATTEEDLDEAAKYLAEAVALIGVQLVMALLLKKGPEVLNQPRRLMDESVTPLTLKTIGEPPVTEGKLFYEGKTVKLPNEFPNNKVEASTSPWGDNYYSYGKRATIKDIELADFHEKVHRFFAPKLQIFPKFRQFRAVLRTNSYLKSYILRYLEEALAETIAQVRGNGWRYFFEGIKFPVGEDAYVTIVEMRTEAKGILLGPINVGGMIYRVYFSYQKDW